MSGEKYIDISSANRDRNVDPNPYDFVVPFYKTAKGSTTLSYFDVVLESAPYSGSLKNIELLETGISIDSSHITLDPSEIDIDNFYIHNVLQIGTQFRSIIEYNGTTKVATVSEPFFAVPPQYTKYYTRKKAVYFNSDVSIYHTTNGMVDQLDLLTAAPSPVLDMYKGSYIRFTNGPHVGETALITKYTPFNSIPIWSQLDLPGSSSYIPTSSAIGFYFKPVKSGNFGQITFNFASYDLSGNRLLNLSLFDKDNNLLFTNNFNIPDSVSRSNITLSISPVVYLTGYKDYKIVLQDVSTIPTDGYINMFGVSSSSSLQTIETSTYPFLIIDIYPLSGSVSWSQPNSLGVNKYLSTSSYENYTFTPNKTGSLMDINLQLTVFESLLAGRTLDLKIFDYANTEIYSNSFTIPPTPVSTLYPLSIAGGPLLYSGTPYTLSLKDTTGSVSGYINLFGVSPSVTFVSSTTIYPRMDILIDNTVAWSQNSNPGVDAYLPYPGTECGFKIEATSSGTLSYIGMVLTSFESVLAGRDVELKIRDGAGLAGTVLYSSVYTIPDTSFSYYIFPISGGPILTSGSTYTLTLKDVTIGGSNGFVNLYGITQTSSFVSYNIPVYPKLDFVVDTGGTSTVWSQTSVSTNSNLSVGENGYLFIPSSSGRVDSITAKISSYGTIMNWRLRIRSGAGLTGDILYTRDYVVSTGLIPVDYLFNTPDGPFVYGGDSYTWTLEVLSGSILDARNIGIPPSGSYVAYNTDVYEYHIISVINATAPFNQPTNLTKTDSVSTVTEKGFSFVSSGDISRPLTSIDLALLCFDPIGRILDIKIYDGTIYDTLLYSGSIAIYPTQRTLLNLSLPFPNLVPGNTYTVSLIDTTGVNTGVLYFYGVYNTSSVYNTTVYPRVNINIVNNKIINWTQPSDPNVCDVIGTNCGSKLVTTTGGQISSISINLDCFDSSSSQRSLNLKILDGAGLGGPVLYNNTFLITTTNGIRKDFSLNISPIPTILSPASIYTIVLSDTSLSATGILYAYGISPTVSYTAYGWNVYPKLSLFSSLPETTFSQPQNPSLTDVLTSSEKGFVFSPIFSANIAGVLLNLASYDVSGFRTLNVKIREGYGFGGTIVSEKTLTITNNRSDLMVAIEIPSPLSQGDIYTLTVKDSSPGINGNIMIYGIAPSPTYVSLGSTIYPRFSTYGYTFIIDISPPKKLTGFLSKKSNALNNVEFNSEAHDNFCNLLYQSLPHTEAHYYKIGLQYLVLPNQLLKVGIGGKLDSYPYVYLRIIALGNRGAQNTISSNNPNSSYAVFKCPVDKNLYDIPDSFFSLTTISKDQIIKFRPDQDFRITVTLPNGEVLQNATSDYTSPLDTNPLLQMSVLFTILPVDKYEETSNAGVPYKFSVRR